MFEHQGFDGLVTTMRRTTPRLVNTLLFFYNPSHLFSFPPFSRTIDTAPTHTYNNNTRNLRLYLAANSARWSEIWSMSFFA